MERKGAPLSPALFKTIVSKLHMPIGAVKVPDLTSDETFLYFSNQAGIDINPVTVPENFGRPVAEIFGREQSWQWRQWQRQVAATGESITIKAAPFDFPSDTRIYDFCMKSIGHNIIFFEYKDVLLERQLLQVKQARIRAQTTFQVKNRLLSYWSHDLQAPLLAVRCVLTTLLKNKNLTKQQEDYVVTILLCASQIANLLSAVQDFARAEINRLQLHYSSCDVKDLVENAISLVKASSEQNNREVILETGERTLTQIDTDRVRLQQVICHLLDNAIRFSSSPVTVRLEIVNAMISTDQSSDSDLTRPEMDKGIEMLHIIIIDQGIGIAPQNHKTIFLPFNQVGERAGFGGRTGFGLAICRIFCLRMGGQIWVESDGLGCGSSFHVLLPLRRVQKRSAQD